MIWSIQKDMNVKLDNIIIITNVNWKNNRKFYLVLKQKIVNCVN